MTSEAHVSETFTLSGGYLDRLQQALDVVAHLAHRARNGGYGRHVDEVLTDIEEVARDQLAHIGNALDADAAEAEGSGDVEQARRSSHPHYRAA
jgi:hypothetical protein